VPDGELGGLEVVDNQSASRFEIHLGIDVAFVAYRATDSAIAYTHTEVPESLKGRGIAGRLAKHALDVAREESLLVVPLCPYVAAYIRQNPKYEDLVAPRRLWRAFLPDRRIDRGSRA
jgi:predicted GNAT family acetyltransferase